MKRDRLLRALIHERFVVTLVDGVTVSGLLAEVDDRVLRFVDAATVSAAAKTQPIDGDLFVERVRVAYLQRP